MAKKIDVDVWAKDNVIRSITFSDGYRYMGKDAAIKLAEHMKGKKPGLMRIHPIA